MVASTANTRVTILHGYGRCRYGNTCKYKRHHLPRGSLASITTAKSMPSRVSPKPRHYEMNRELSEAMKFMNIADIDSMTEPILRSLYKGIALATHPYKFYSASEEEIATAAFQTLESAFRYLKRYTRLIGTVRCVLWAGWLAPVSRHGLPDSRHYRHRVGLIALMFAWSVSRYFVLLLRCRRHEDMQIVSSCARQQYVSGKNETYSSIESLVTPWIGGGFSLATSVVDQSAALVFRSAPLRFSNYYGHGKVTYSPWLLVGGSRAGGSRCYCGH